MTEKLAIGSARPVSTLKDARLTAALGWWEGLRPEGGGVPPMDRFCLPDVPESIVPHLAVCTGFTPDGRIRAEFVGTVAAMFAGGDALGRYLDEVYPAYAARISADLFRRVEEMRVPLAGIFDLGLKGTPLLVTQRLYLPFAGPTGGIDLFAAVLTYAPTAEGRAQRPRIFKKPLDVLRMELFPVDPS